MNEVSNSPFQNEVKPSYIYEQSNTSVPFNPAWCQYRLPCGYCTRLNRECVKGLTNVTSVTYTSDQTASINQSGMENITSVWSK